MDSTYELFYNNFFFVTSSDDSFDDDKYILITATFHVYEEEQNALPNLRGLTLRHANMI